jgi:hypothetical protein
MIYTQGMENTAATPNQFTEAAAENERGYKVGLDVGRTSTIAAVVEMIESYSDPAFLAEHAEYDYETYSLQFVAGYRFGLLDALHARDAYYATK